MILNIITAYMQILFNDELLTTANLVLNNTQQQLDRTRKLYKAGSLAEASLLELEAQFAADELNVEVALSKRALRCLAGERE